MKQGIITLILWKKKNAAAYKVSSISELAVFNDRETVYQETKKEKHDNNSCKQ